MREGIFDRHLDTAGLGRCRRRPGRRPARSGTSIWASRAGTDGRDSQQGSLLGPELLATRRSAPGSRSAASRYSSSSPRRWLLKTTAALLAGPRGGLVPGPHGVRPAGPGQPQHHRRRAQHRDAGHDEPQDQVPRVLPALRPLRCWPSTSRNTSTSPCESPYMLLIAAVRKELRRDLDPEQMRLMKDPDLRKRVNVPRSSLPAITHVDCRRARADRGRGAARPVLPAHARSSSGRRVRGHHQHQLQHPRRADRLHAPGRVSLLPGLGDGCPRAGELPAAPLRAARPQPEERQKYIAGFKPD